MANGFACARKDRGVTCYDCDLQGDTQACADNARTEIARLLAARSEEIRRATLDGSAETVARICRFLRTLARKDVATENKLAANGAYKSASEAANWRMGVEAAVEAIEGGAWVKEADHG